MNTHSYRLPFIHSWVPIKIYPVVRISRSNGCEKIRMMNLQIGIQMTLVLSINKEWWKLWTLSQLWLLGNTLPGRTDACDASSAHSGQPYQVRKACGRVFRHFLHHTRNPFADWPCRLALITGARLLMAIDFIGTSPVVWGGTMYKGNLLGFLVFLWYGCDWRLLSSRQSISLRLRIIWKYVRSHNRECSFTQRSLLLN